MIEQTLFDTPEPTPAPPVGSDPWAPVHFRLYGWGWPCPDCTPIPTHWPTADTRDRHHTNTHRTGE